MKYCSLLFIAFLLIFCSDKKSPSEIIKNKSQKHQPKKEFNNYWYDGTAEITSYKLQQFRYGEIHEGTAVNVYVTEPFLPKKQVKADYRNEKNVPVLKLNSTKKFVTGIYPYSIMTSTFSPININEQAIKISFSSQEWCGNTFAQLNNREEFDVNYYSYFENDTDRKLTIKKVILENEIWNLIRISPKKLPVGRFDMIPSFEFLALNHKKIKSYNAAASLSENNSFYTYNIYYPKLKRTLSLKFEKKFPFKIESWEEKLEINGEEHITTAKKITNLKSKYWSKNKNKNKIIRKKLGI